MGALEQAGPHLPLGTNVHIAGAVVDAVARRTGILRAPAFPYGVTLKGSSRFAGTAGLRRKTFHRAVNELLADWEDHGVEPGLEHAGEVETSLLLHLLPEAVSTAHALDSSPTASARSRYLRGHHPTPPQESHGVIGFPSRATAAKGAAIFARYVDALSELLLANGGPEREPRG